MSLRKLILHVYLIIPVAVAVPPSSYLETNKKDELDLQSISVEDPHPFQDLSPLNKIKSTLPCLPTDSLHKLETLVLSLKKIDAGRAINPLISRLEVTDSKIHELVQDGLAAQVLAPGMAHWFLARDTDQIRNFTEKLNGYLKPSLEWLNKEALVLKLSQTSEEPSAIYDSLLPIMWRIGPVTLFRLEKLRYSVNFDGLVTSVIEMTESTFSKVDMILDSEQLLVKILPKVVDWVETIEIRKVYEWIEFANLQLKSFLIWANEQKF